MTGAPGIPPGWVMVKCCTFCALPHHAAREGMSTPITKPKVHGLFINRKYCYTGQFSSRATDVGMGWSPGLKQFDSAALPGLAQFQICTAAAMLPETKPGGQFQTIPKLPQAHHELSGTKQREVFPPNGNGFCSHR